MGKKIFAIMLSVIMLCQLVVPVQAEETDSSAVDGKPVVQEEIIVEEEDIIVSEDDFPRVLENEVLDADSSVHEEIVEENTMSGDGWAAAYTRILDNWKLIEQYIDTSYLKMYFGSLYRFDQYTVFDLDGNRIPELFLYSTTMNLTAVFTYDTELIGLDYLMIDRIDERTGNIIEHGHFHGAGGSGANEWSVYTFDPSKPSIERWRYIDILGERITIGTSFYNDDSNEYDMNYDRGTKDEYDAVYNEYIDPAKAYADYKKYKLSDKTGLRTGSEVTESKYLALYPENGERNVNPKLYGDGYDIVVCFDEVVAKNSGKITISANTGEKYTYDINDRRVKAEESVLTIKGVPLPYNAAITVILEKGCVYVGGKKFVGLSKADEWVFYTKRQEQNFLLDDFVLGRDTFRFNNSEKSIGVENGKAFPVNVVNWDVFLHNSNYSLDDISAIYEGAKSFGGVCYGMSSVLMQNYIGMLDLSEYQSDATVLHDLGYPSKTPKVQELIGINHYIQFGSQVVRFRSAFNKNYSGNKSIRRLYELVSQIDRNNKPVLIDYYWISNIDNYRNGLDDSLYGHTVVAIGIETKGAPYRYNGREYAYCIRTIDPNNIYSKDKLSMESCIYISEDFNDCIIPNSGATTDSLSEDSLVFYGDEIDQNNEMWIGWVTNNINEVRNLGISSDSNGILRVASSDVIINGEVVTGSNIEEKEWVDAVIYETGQEDSKASAAMLVKPGEYNITTEYSGKVSYQVNDTFSNVETADMANIQFQKNGSVSIDTPGEYSISLTSEDISADEGVNKVIVSGENTDNITVQVKNKSIRITGDDLNGVKVITGDVLGQNQSELTIDEKLRDVTIQSDSEGIVLKKPVVKPDKPILNKAISGNSSLEVTWQPVDDVDGYRVYRKTNSGKWKGIANTSATTYKDSKVNVGYTYTYTVRAYRLSNGKALYSNYDAKGKSTRLNTFINVSSPKIGTASVTWQKTTGARGYYIYRATSKGGKYKKIKTVTNGKTIKYTNTKLSEGKTYYYKVTPYGIAGGKKIAGNSSTAKGIKIKATQIKLSESQMTLEIGEAEALKVTPVKLSSQVKWVSDDPAVAAASKKGVVTAKQEGSTTITAKAQNGSEASCIVTVIRNSPDVIQIYNAQQLSDIQKDLSGEYILMEDINIEGISWQSIGDRINPFKGSLDGNNHTVSGYNSSYGLFGHVTGEIRNLNISGTITKTGNDSNTPDSLGAIVNTLGGGRIIDCVSDVDISYSGGAVSYGENGVGGLTVIGGIAGRMEEQSEIRDCTNNGVIEIDNFMLMVGGIAGNAEKDTEISDSRNNGTITYSQKSKSNIAPSIGGILGYGSSHEAPSTCCINNSENSGSVVCDFLSGGMVGGIAGRMNDGLIKGCMNVAVVKGTVSEHHPGLYVGGIVAFTAWSNVSDSINRGTVLARETVGGSYTSGSEEGIYAGGIAGYVSPDAPYNCSNTGAVQAIAMSENKAYEGEIYGYWQRW